MIDPCFLEEIPTKTAMSVSLEGSALCGDAFGFQGLE
jgi:hypothetical protein